MAIAIPGSEEEFSALSWLELARLSYQCATGDGTDYMGLLGYKKPIDVSGVGTVQVKVIGINHDTFTDGSTAGLTFQLTDGLSVSKPVIMKMNASNITTGGWRDSVMRKTNIPALLAALPSDLRAVIKKVTKKSSTSQTGTAVVETEDDLFLLSLIESIGTTKTAYTDNPITSSTYMINEGSQYEYYKQFDSNKTEAFNHHIIKADSGSADYWWLRSIRWNRSSSFYGMGSSGNWSNYSGSNFCLPAAGFCISAPPPPPLYLAGDTENAPEWVDADSEHVFLDETCDWSKIGGGSVSHSIRCKVAESVFDIATDCAFTSCPESANAGDRFSVEVSYTPKRGVATLKAAYLGYVMDDGGEDAPTLSDFVEKASGSVNGTHAFTMPDCDIVVWVITANEF